MGLGVNQKSTHGLAPKSHTLGTGTSAGGEVSGTTVGGGLGGSGTASGGSGTGCAGLGDRGDGSVPHAAMKRVSVAKRVGHFNASTISTPTAPTTIRTIARTRQPARPDGTSAKTLSEGTLTHFPATAARGSSETLDTALSALETLQASGRQVGLISHVSGLAEQIGTEVGVERLGGGRSRVRVTGATVTATAEVRPAEAATAAKAAPKKRAKKTTGSAA